MNFQYNNYKNFGIGEKVVSIYKVEVKNKDQAIKLGKILNENKIMYKISGIFYVLVICEEYSQISVLGEILKEFGLNKGQEKLAVMYEIVGSKEYLNELKKLLHENGIFKIYNPFYQSVKVFCGTSFQIKKLESILNELDHRINAE